MSEMSDVFTTNQMIVSLRWTTTFETNQWNIKSISTHVLIL